MSLNDEPWKPPEGFHPAHSHVDGISVYAPLQGAPGQSEQDTLFKCASCGSTTEYTVAVGGLRCAACGNTTPIDSDRDFPKGIHQEFTLEAMRRGAQGWGANRRAWRCLGCGGEMAVTETANAAQSLSNTCPFCGSNQVALGDSCQTSLQPGHVLPFIVSVEAVKNTLSSWLGNSWVHPKSLRRLASLERLQGVYLPVWRFSSSVHCRWRGKVGTETHTVNSDTNETETSVHWKWEEGEMTLPFSDVLIAGTSHIRESFFDEVKCFDPSAIKPYSPGYLAGWSAQAYDVFLPEAWTTAKEHLRERSKEACWRSTGGDRVRQFTGRFQFNDEIWHYDLHPFFVASYQFGRKTYQVLISGHSGHIVGHQPVAWWKVYTLVALFQLPAILLFLLTLIALLFPPALIILFVFWVVFLFLGIVGSILLVRWAYAKENA